MCMWGTVVRIGEMLFDHCEERRMMIHILSAQGFFTEGYFLCGSSIDGSFCAD